MENPTPPKRARRFADDADKSNIHKMICDLVKEHTGHDLPRPIAKLILDASVEMIFRTAIERGYFRFPSGYGSLHLKQLGAGSKPKKLPQGGEVMLASDRTKLRYFEGIAVKERLGTNKAKYQRKTQRESAIPAEYQPGEPEEVA